MFKTLVLTLAVAACGVAGAKKFKTLVSIGMTSPVTFQNGITTLCGKYWGINQTQIKPNLVYLNNKAIQPNGMSYWPVNITRFGRVPQTNTTLVDIDFPFSGFVNINPYYGSGLFINWTDTGTKNVLGHPNYLFYFKKVNLGVAPLAQICLQNCYCESWLCHPSSK